MANGVRLDPAALARLVDDADLPDLAARAGVALRRSGRGFVALCPFHAERTPSFHLDRKGPRWRYRCFGCGAGGDALAFVTSIHRVPTADAIRILGGDAVPRLDPAAATREAERRRAMLARAAEAEARDAAKAAADVAVLWRAAVRPAEGDAVATYLAARGLPIEAWPGGLPPCIRLAPALHYWWTPPDGRRAVPIGRFPAMVTAVQGADDLLIGVHLTYLAPDGAGKATIADPETAAALPAKKVRGRAWGGAIRLAEPGPKTGWRLGLAEGIETAASVLIAMGGSLPVWSAVSLGNLAGAGLGTGRPHPDPARVDADGRRLRLPSAIPDPERPGLVLPDAVDECVILADADSKDPPSFEATLARAAHRHGIRRDGSRRRCRIARPAPGGDFNDMIRPPAAAEGRAA
jgi:DNA primase